MAVTDAWTSPEEGGSLDLSTGGTITQTIWEGVLSDLYRLGGAGGTITPTAAGLPANVKLLGNRNAAGEFVQHGVSGDVSTSAATSFTQAGEVAVTFPVAHAAAPRVFTGGNYVGAILCYAKDISTTGCTLGAVRGDTQTVKINYITLGT